jgi:hypothetical protein
MNVDPQFITDLVKFAQDHPAVTTAITGWIAASEGLPFIKRLKANGVLHLLLVIAKAVMDAVISAAAKKSK